MRQRYKDDVVLTSPLMSEIAGPWSGAMSATLEMLCWSGHVFYLFFDCGNVLHNRGSLNSHHRTYCNQPWETGIRPIWHFLEFANQVILSTPQSPGWMLHASLSWVGAVSPRSIGEESRCWASWVIASYDNFNLFALIFLSSEQTKKTFKRWFF